MQYRPYIPQTVGELLDKLADMMLTAPTFKDKTGFFPQKNIVTAFFALNEGLLVVRKQLGEECFAALKAMSGEMRTLFESDPGDRTGDTQKGRDLIGEMEDILLNVAKRQTEN